MSLSHPFNMVQSDVFTSTWCTSHLNSQPSENPVSGKEKVFAFAGACRKKVVGLQLQCLQPHLQMLPLSPDENVSGRSFSTPTCLQRPQRNTCRASFAFFAWQRVKVRWENANVPTWVATKGRGAKRPGEALGAPGEAGRDARHCGGVSAVALTLTRQNPGCYIYQAAVRCQLRRKKKQAAPRLQPPSRVQV